MSNASGALPRFLDPEQIIPISRLSTEVTKTGEWSSRRPDFAEKASPCRFDCPNGNNIPGALLAAAQGDFDGALAAFLEESPLPGVCGIVCHHPCQEMCNRIGLDGAVQIRALERAAAERGNAVPAVLSDAGQGKPVAVVGAGPAGLAAAYHLGRLGHPVTVFEAGPAAGGLLRCGIPDFRLPKAALDRELARFAGLPVTFRTGARTDLAGLAALEAGHQAVFLGLGAAGDVPLGAAGEELGGVLSALEFLKRPDLHAAAKGARVVVVGGGNTAMDAARAALRLGAEDVLVLYRRASDQLPAFADEVEEAKEEGVRFRFLAGPAALLGEDGRVSRIRCLEMTRAAGRNQRPDAVEGSAFEVPCDLVLSATGQAPVLTGAPEDLRTASGRLWVDGRCRTGRKGVFAGGDVALARGSVVEAMASGKRAALAIHLALTQGTDASSWVGAELGGGPTLSLQAFFRPPTRWDPETVVRLAELDYLGVELRPPLETKRRDPAERLGDLGEVGLPVGAEAAVAEARRCFYCGTCAGCDKCRLYCPDSSIAPEEEPGGRAAYLADNAYCKGCGTCAEACPRGVLGMREVELR